MDILATCYRCLGIPRNIRLVMKYLLLLLLVVSCAKPNYSYIAPTVYTYPEERNMLMAVPVVPVEIKELEN